MDLLIKKLLYKFTIGQIQIVIFILRIERHDKHRMEKSPLLDIDLSLTFKISNHKYLLDFPYCQLLSLKIYQVGESSDKISFIYSTILVSIRYVIRKLKFIRVCCHWLMSFNWLILLISLTKSW
jgi:hypothetical protein